MEKKKTGPKMVFIDIAGSFFHSSGLSLWFGRQRPNNWNDMFSSNRTNKPFVISTLGVSFAVQ